VRARIATVASLLLVLVVLASSRAIGRPAAAGATAPKIEVGPNMLVSRDGDVPHVELHVSANPKNARNLVGGAITSIRPEGGWACRAYASKDGGMTWKASEFAEQLEWGGGDPYTAFTPQGTAIFSALDFKKDEKGRVRGFLHLYRSTDGGFNWSEANELGYSYDHEQIVVDQTKGRYSGRIYIGVLYGYPIYTVGVFRSEDDGKSWIGPVDAANGGGTIGINEVTPVVLSDGTLVLPYGDFQFQPDKRPTKGRVFGSTTWTVSSTDGGVTFGAPQKVVQQQYNLDDKETSLAGFGKFAADSESKKYRDRIYTAWEDSRPGPYRILFARSSDRGKTWSAPKAIDESLPKNVHQLQPAIAVNKEGTIAVTWFDARNGKTAKQYDQFMAVSVDGGDSFLPPVRVSSATSDSAGRGNSQISPMVFKDEDKSVHLSFLSAASRWGSGGDYMGLTADKDGVFHPFWADSRSGTFQVYTATVRVELPPSDEKADKADKAGKGGSTAAPAKASATPAPRVETDLTDRVEVIFDPTRFDPSTKEAEIPVRLKNVSNEPIYPPIRVEIAGFGMPKYENEDDKKRNAENAPTVLNASNGKAKEGAVFDFKDSLGTAEALQPGALTDPLLMRFRFVDAAKAPSVQWKVTGMTAGK